MGRQVRALAWWGRLGFEGPSWVGPGLPRRFPGGASEAGPGGTTVRKVSLYVGGRVPSEESSGFTRTGALVMWAGRPSIFQPPFFLCVSPAREAIVFGLPGLCSGRTWSGSVSRGPAGVVGSSGPWVGELGLPGSSGRSSAPGLYWGEQFLYYRKEVVGSSGGGG